MECTHCHNSARYNRAVVRERDGRLLTGLCSDCEGDLFGRVLRDVYVESGHDCLFCSSPGAVSLPVHRIDLSEAGGPQREERGFPTTDLTPRLCDDHAADLLGVTVETLRPDASLASYAVRVDD